MESRSGSKRRYDEVEPRVQRRIVAEYRQGVRGYGYIATAKRLQLPVSTVRGVIARAERAGGDPVAPRGHKKRKLDSGEEVKLCRALEQNSTATNRQLSAVVRGKVAARTVSDYLARADPPFTTKVIQDQEPEELTEEWRPGAAVVGGCEEDSLGANGCYEDETPVFANEAPKRGRARGGNTHPSSAISLRHKVHVAFWAQSGVLCCIGALSDRNADTKEIERVATDAVGVMKSGDTVIWDRLGRSGRAVNPSSQHYSPVARDLLLLFNDLKQHYIRPNFPKKRSTAVQVKDCRAYSRVCG
jgi:transposase